MTPNTPATTAAAGTDTTGATKKTATAVQSNLIPIFITYLIEKPFIIIVISIAQKPRISTNLLCLSVSLISCCIFLISSFRFSNNFFDIFDIF